MRVYLSSSLSAVDDFFHLIDILDGSGQVIITSLGDQDIVLDTDASNGPVLLQNLEVDVWGVDWITEVWLNNEVAEVDLSQLVNPAACIE